MKDLSMNSHVMLTRDEFETLRLCELPNVIYKRVHEKWVRILGVRAERILNKYAERPFREVADCTVVNVWDCFYVL